MNAEAGHYEQASNSLRVEFKQQIIKVINFDSPRGGISLVTEKGVLTTSRLLVQKAIQQDSGLYTCTPSNANPTSVRVHIVDAAGILFTSAAFMRIIVLFGVTRAVYPSLYHLPEHNRFSHIHARKPNRPNQLRRSATSSTIPKPNGE